MQLYKKAWKPRLLYHRCTLPDPSPFKSASISDSLERLKSPEFECLRQDAATAKMMPAADAIKRISSKYPEMLIGAGTVINPQLAEKAINAGAKFIVSPGFNLETVNWCLDRNVPVIPGVATPSEIEKALALGLTVLKFFPAESSGGVKMLKDLNGPFPLVKFIVTGGIKIDNLIEYAKEANVLAIGGSWMVKADLIASLSLNIKAFGLLSKGPLYYRRYG